MCFTEYSHYHDYHDGDHDDVGDNDHDDVGDDDADGKAAEGDQSFSRSAPPSERDSISWSKSEQDYKMCMKGVVDEVGDDDGDDGDTL